jgi:hypothetical protein
MMRIGPTMLKIFKIDMLYDAHWSHNVKNLKIDKLYDAHWSLNVKILQNRQGI